MFSLLRKVTPRFQPTSAILLAPVSLEGNETIYNKLKSWCKLQKILSRMLGVLSTASAAVLSSGDSGFHVPMRKLLMIISLQQSHAILKPSGSRRPSISLRTTPIDVRQLNSSRAELTEAIKPFMLRDHPVQLGPLAIEFHSPAPYRFPQGAYSTAVPLSNRIYARDRRLTVLLNTEVLNVDFTRPTLEIGAVKYMRAHNFF